MTALIHTLPAAHIGHWLWVFYLIPVLIVVGGIIRTTRAEKRREAKEERGSGAKRPAADKRRG